MPQPNTLTNTPNGSKWCVLKGDWFPIRYEISHPSTNKWHHLAATSPFRLVLSDKFRSQSTRRNHVNLQNHGCGRFRLWTFECEVSQAWLLAVTQLSHVDVQVYWIKHTELGGLDPGESTNMQMYYIPRIDWEKSNVTILKVLRQYIPTYKPPCQRFIYVT